MRIVSQTLKTAALAGALGIATLAATTVPAAAYTYTRCDYDGDHCVRIHCDWDGDDCWRQSIYRRQPYYYGEGHWVCDGDGDYCRWEYYGRPYWRRYYGRPYLGFGLDWHN